MILTVSVTNEDGFFLELDSGGGFKIEATYPTEPALIAALLALAKSFDRHGLEAGLEELERRLRP